MSNRIVSRDEWLDARRELLVAEKAFTRQRDDMSRRLRDLPWVRVEKEYVFQGAEGDVTLAELFGDFNQLIVYHFMFDPDWEKGCGGCTGLINAMGDLSMLNDRDTTFALISRAPLEKLLKMKDDQGWNRT